VKMISAPHISSYTVANTGFVGFVWQVLTPVHVYYSAFENLSARGDVSNDPRSYIQYMKHYGRSCWPETQSFHIAGMVPTPSTQLSLQVIIPPPPPVRLIFLPNYLIFLLDDHLVILHIAYAKESFYRSRYCIIEATRRRKLI
jgi:hypothetical protein